MVIITFYRYLVIFTGLQKEYIVELEFKLRQCASLSLDMLLKLSNGAPFVAQQDGCLGSTGPRFHPQTGTVG